MDELGKKLEKEQEKEKRKKTLALQGKYSQRITIAKHGREMFLTKDYVGATKKYNEYLWILAEMHEAQDIFDLSPAMFDNQRDITEMLLISHIYWELSRVYEMTPKLQKTFEKALRQFVRFTTNQPYQVLNSEMLRKYIKKNKNKTRQLGALNGAYSQIQVQSRKCFVSTFALGDKHWVTQELRLFKSSTLGGDQGARVVAFYYKNSDKLVRWLEANPRFGFALKLLVRPALTGLAKTLVFTRGLNKRSSNNIRKI